MVVTRTCVGGLAGVIAAVGTALLAQEPRAVLVRSLPIPTEGATLAADLYVPAGAPGPVPGVVFVHGSERVPRDRYRGFADRLAAVGVATLVYDKRGVGESTGRFQSLTAENSETLLRQLARDARSAAATLATQAEVDSSKVGLFGGSQAGWVMPLAGVTGPPVAFLVVLAGPAVSVGLEIAHGRITREREHSAARPTPDEVRTRLAAYRGPAGFDPTDTLRALKVPTLWFLGGRDRNLPLEESLAALEPLRASSGGRFTLVVEPDADHQFVRLDGSRADYMTTFSKWLQALDGAK